MPFPPTPSNTPSNTPTPSITASVTPTQTPTGTPCPGFTPTATSTIPVTPTSTQTNTPTQTPTSTVGTTPTQTPSHTPTPSATVECTCFSSATVNVTVAGNITFNDCNGNPTIENFNPGNGQTYGDGTFCIRKDTNAGTAEYTIVSYNDCCTSPPGDGIWTVSNYDCGLGTVNDVGINSNFMGSLPLGPSTFPLTSTLGGSRQYPNGVVNGSNTIQINHHLQHNYFEIRSNNPSQQKS